MSNLGIALFTYKRPWHTNKVLESLKKNPVEKLYIFQDGLKKDQDREAWLQVSELIRHIDFVPTEVFIADKNRGLANSIINGINYVFSKHDQAIALEDDVCLSGSYLRFMRACFDKYKSSPAVSCVAGGGWPVEIPADYSFDAFCSYRMSSIAWGTWKDRWQQFSRDYTLLAAILRDEEKRAILERSGSDICAIMQAQIMGQCDSWALFWTLMQINNRQVCVLPARYLAQDIGHDGAAGTNSVKRTTRFDTELLELADGGINLPDSVVVNDSIMEQIKRVLNGPVRETRLETYYASTQKWIECLQKGRSFPQYFSEKGIYSVYIYGDSDLARLMIRQLEGSVKIQGILVHDKSQDTFCGYNVYDFSDNISLENADIIVTPIHDWDYIAYSVQKRFGKQNLIHLQAMLDELCEREQCGI